jgi:squalene synthase HpnC
MARSHYENFPVASVLLPPGMRRHIAALYAFARAADDFADEGDRSNQQRLSLLEGWNARLTRAVRGESQAPAETGEPADAPAVFDALRNTIQQCGLPPALLADLLSAFRQDVLVQRYPNWEQLFDYARRSANPVGRLVLRIAGHRDNRLEEWSDAICTALQFTNFWQDFEIDLARGRMYLPQSELVQQGARDSDVAVGQLPDPLRVALGHAVERTRMLFALGRPLCDETTGRLRYELRATWLGGTRILDRLDAQLRCRGERLERPALALRDAPWFAWRMITWTP